jgi:hypothetical protein
LGFCRVHTLEFRTDPKAPLGSHHPPSPHMSVSHVMAPLPILHPLVHWLPALPPPSCLQAIFDRLLHARERVFSHSEHVAV